MMKDDIHGLKPFWNKLMVDASAKYGKCSHSSDVLMYMRREFIHLVDSIALDGMTDQTCYSQVQKKVSEAYSSERENARKDEKVYVIEMKDGNNELEKGDELEKSDAEESEQMVEDNVLEKAHAEKSEQMVEHHDSEKADDEELEQKVDAHSSEVSTPPETMTRLIRDKIRKDMETEKTREENRINNFKKELEKMEKEENPEDNEDIRNEMARMRREIEKEREDDKHRKSRHTTNWFVQKLDQFQEYKMLGCKECIVSFDPQAMVAVPKKIEALKYVSFETTAHMEWNFNQCEAALFHDLVLEDKFSLTCWPFELAQFAATSIAHAFHAKHVICGAVDSSFENQTEFQMPLEIKGPDIVLVIGCHSKHYALLEVVARKRKVIIRESTQFEKTSTALDFWMECILILLKRHFKNELEEDCSNVLPYGSKVTKAAKKNKKKIWWVQCTVGYIQEGEDECGAVAFNQLAWRLKELTGSP